MTETPKTPEVEPTTETAPEAEPPKANKEARYRVERNQARGERDALAERVERMQRAEVERLAADALSHPADLFSLSGNGVADYLTEAGDVDAAKVAADVAAVLAERPGLKRHAPAFDPTVGTGGRTTPPKATPSWSALIRASDRPGDRPSMPQNHR
ncbi:hypothetical protein [Mycolicibacterium neoaurum]|uniref:hypothetical protein n=1 Tax=Mycolicibacterium neoaurum TaxID=1795 RepID=UPI001F4CCE63|nr:hypothetical protein [Mycolicibacterium neoaurum]